MISPARRVAFEVLKRVHGGAHSDAMLLEMSAELESRDAGLAQEIVYGVLRRQNQLDFLGRHFSGREILTLDASTAILLRMGIYQMRYLSRIPAHAAVMESVEQAKRMSKRAAAGLLNAILRKVHKRELEWPDEATAAGMPEWLWEKWKRDLGEERAWEAAEAGLEAAGKQMRGAVRMDEGAQKVVPLLGLAAGQRLLDVCAAPGNKTRQAMETVKDVVACDRSFPRLAGLRRLRVPLVQLDAAKPLPFRPVFDRVLADVPCSGTGTLGRNPEIKWRLTPEELIRQRDRQRSILYEALRALKPGGRVVYATCSLEKEENEEVVAATPGIRVIEELRIYPGQAGTDGFYAAAIERAE